METIEIPEPVASCECKRTDIQVLNANRSKNGTSVVVGRVVCRDCGEVQTQLTSAGYDDVFRLTFGAGLQEKMAASREAKALAKANKPAPAKPERPSKSLSDPSKGLPGTEMLLLTSELGIVAPPGCGCKGMAATMDKLGVDGCRQRHLEIKLAVEANWEAWGWKDKLKAATSSAWKAVGLGVRPTDPVRDLVEIAIERADKKRETA